MDCWFKKLKKEIIDEILENEGFIDAINHVKKVMYGNMNSTNPKTEAITGLWAKIVLQQFKYQVIRNNSSVGYIKHALIIAMEDYINEVNELHREVRLKISKNAIGNNSQIIDDDGVTEI